LKRRGKQSRAKFLNMRTLLKKKKCGCLVVKGIREVKGLERTIKS